MQSTICKWWDSFKDIPLRNFRPARTNTSNRIEKTRATNAHAMGNAQDWKKNKQSKATMRIWWLPSKTSLSQFRTHANMQPKKRKNDKSNAHIKIDKSNALKVSSAWTLCRPLIMIERQNRKLQHDWKTRHFFLCDQVLLCEFTNAPMRWDSRCPCISCSLSRIFFWQAILSAHAKTFLVSRIFFP